MTATLDEIISMVRDGLTSRAIAGELGVSERYIRNRFQEAGRLSEYRNALMDAGARRAAAVDVDAIMGFADEGMTLNRACVEAGCSRADALARLEDESRVVEFYARSYAAREGGRLPVVDAGSYHAGPREFLVSLIPGLSPGDADRMRAAIGSLDAMARDGAALSRLCGGVRVERRHAAPPHGRLQDRGPGLGHPGRHP